jgi:hypothetical protein
MIKERAFSPQFNQFFNIFLSYFHFFKLLATSSIKTVRAGELDCPQDNQAQQASTNFRIETGLSIVFIYCCA